MIYLITCVIFYIKLALNIKHLIHEKLLTSVGHWIWQALKAGSYETTKQQVAMKNQKKNKTGLH